MTPAESQQIDEIDDLLERVAETAERAGLTTKLQVSVGYVVFRHYQDRYDVDDASVVWAKCSCGSCGNMVLILTTVVATDGDDVRDPTWGAMIELTRSATRDETVEYLSQIPS